MALTGPAFVGPLSVPAVTRPDAFLKKISSRRVILKPPTIRDRRVSLTSAASDKSTTSATEHSVTAATPATPAHDDHPVVSTNFGDEIQLLEESCIKSLDDISELVDIVEECEFADFRISHNGVTVEISREGGRGFDAEGCLRDLSLPSYESPVQVPMPEQEMRTAAFHNIPDSNKNEIVESNGDVPAIESTPPTSSTAEEEKDPDKIYDTDFVVTSNRVGFFFSGAKNKPPLVNVDDSVAFNQPVCIIEQLGQQYVYLSEASGKVVKILVEDGDPVEYGSQVMVIRPD